MLEAGRDGELQSKEPPRIHYMTLRGPDKLYKDHGNKFSEVEPVGRRLRSGWGLNQTKSYLNSPRHATTLHHHHHIRAPPPPPQRPSSNTFLMGADRQEGQTQRQTCTTDCLETCRLRLGVGEAGRTSRPKRRVPSPPPPAARPAALCPEEIRPVTPNTRGDGRRQCTLCWYVVKVGQLPSRMFLPVRARRLGRVLHPVYFPIRHMRGPIQPIGSVGGIWPEVGGTRCLILLIIRWILEKINH